MGTLLLAIGIVLNTVANALFKSGSGLQDLTVRKGVLIGTGLFIGFLGTISYIKSLEKIELGTAFPVFSAATIVLVALVSYVLFHEAISAQKGVGLLLLCAGLALIWRG
jgi:multidrug transporter EmrE-like cation transporter